MRGFQTSKGSSIDSRCDNYCILLQIGEAASAEMAAALK